MTVNGDDYMDAAANTPLADDPTENVVRALYGYSTAEEWLAALARRPNILGLENQTESDRLSALKAACLAAPDSPVAQDARARGLLT